MSQRDDFLREMASAQDELLRHGTGVAHVQVKARLRHAKPARRRLALPILLSAGCAAAIAAVVAWRAPMRFEIGEAGKPGEIGAAIVAPDARPVDLRFSDGSYLALGPGARARVTTIDRRGAAILVERGHADVSVIPRKNGSWRVDIGPFEILVKGTRFSIDWDPADERLDFQLQKGAVVITAPCLPGGRSLVAGESLRASCRPAPEALPAIAPRADVTPEPRVPGDLDDVRASGATWRRLAGAQDYRAALDAALRLGFDAECRRANAADLLVLGDVARLAGDAAHAQQAYEAARRKKPAAGRSAFAIGLLEFDHRHRYRHAADWFQTYVTEQPEGPLVEEAQGRLMEAWQRSGEPIKARAAGQAYLARYPRGQYADLARRLTRAE